MTAILGLSAFDHESAAALVVDGRICAAAQEERFTRRREAGLPARAAAFCLRNAGLQPRDLDAVVLSAKPLARFDRLLETYLACAPRGLNSFLAAIPQWLQRKLYLPRTVRRGLPGRYRGPLRFIEHHEAHAASAFFPSPFEEAAILTLDGICEWATATFGIGRGTRLELWEETRFPHRLDLLYGIFTAYCGLPVHGGKDRLPDLAPFGQPVYRDVILEHLLDLKPDGSFRLNPAYFHLSDRGPSIGPRFCRLFGGPPRPPAAPLRQRELDLTASIQAVAEEIVLRMARHVHERTGQQALVLAGDIFRNAAVNGRLLREGPFHAIWVQPAVGDAGAALGAALFAYHHQFDGPRQVNAEDSQHGSLLGPEFTASDGTAFLRGAEAVAHRPNSEAELLGSVAELLAAGKIVGWFHGRMEFGPHALGARTILADPRGRHTLALVNRKLGVREAYAPLLACVLEEYARDFFHLPPEVSSPYALFAVPVAQAQRLPGHETHQWAREGLDRLHIPRSTIPAVTHVDNTAQVQTVDARRHGRFYRLLQAFHRHTGCPVLGQTDFRLCDEPIVCTPADAYRCFLHADLDALVLDDYLLVKGMACTDLDQHGTGLQMAARQATA